jgi:hypothetical protein
VPGAPSESAIYSHQLWWLFFFCDAVVTRSQTSVFDRRPLTLARKEAIIIQLALGRFGLLSHETLPAG